MNRRDCGNHRTGQPRCAQLIANTWNWSPPIRRTQHAIFAVGPAHADRNGFSYVARRVCTSGKLATAPSLIHAWPARPRTGPKMKPMTGMAASVAAAALSARPSVKRNPRREVGDGSISWSAHMASPLSFRLALSRGATAAPGRPKRWGAWGAPGAPHVLCPAGDQRPLRGEPGDDVRDLLWRERAARDVPAPVGHAEICSSRDHGRAQILIAHEREIRRVHDRTRLRPAAPVRAMAARTGRGVDGAPARRIAELRGVRRDAHTPQGVGPRPRCLKPLNQRVDL